MNCVALWFAAGRYRTASFLASQGSGLHSRSLGFHGDTITANILKRLFIINHMAVDLLHTVVMLEEPKVLYVQLD